MTVCVTLFMTLFLLIIASILRYAIQSRYNILGTGLSLVSCAPRNNVTHYNTVRSKSRLQALSCLFVVLSDPLAGRSDPLFLFLRTILELFNGGSFVSIPSSGWPMAKAGGGLKPSSAKQQVPDPALPAKP